MHFFGEPPPEMIEAMKQQEAHRQMHVSDVVHRIKNLIGDMTDDQLETMALYTSVVKGEISNAYYAGLINTYRELKFDVCPCGQDHDPSALLGDDAPVAEKHVEPEDEPAIPEKDAPDWSKTPDGVLEDMVAPLDGPAHDQLCAEYGIELDPMYGEPVIAIDSGVMPPQKYRCVNCGKGYPSLEDRMLRKPGMDGCGGCQEKSAWG